MRNDYIALLAKSVREKLVADAMESRYFGNMCDSTTDASHQDQHSLAVRYTAVPKAEKIIVKETVLGFINF